MAKHREEIASTEEIEENAKESIYSATKGQLLLSLGIRSKLINPFATQVGY